MMSLLSDEELQEEIGVLIERLRAVWSSNDDEYYPDDLNNDLFDLINTQKRLYAESVINTETTAVYSKADTIERASQQIMANVKAQQRARITTNNSKEAAPNE